jgi:single-stranded-DNA-specific exonuclease
VSSRGSARSHGGFNIIEALRERADLFERHGGHAQAAGFTIANSNIEELRKHLLNWYESSKPSLETLGAVTETSELTLHGEVIEQEITTPTDKVDLVIANPDALTYDAYNKISLLSPFGAGNPEPVFRMNNLHLTRRWTSGPAGRHLRVRLKANNRQFNGTYFRGGSQLDSFKEGSLVHVIFCLEPVWNPPAWENKQDIWLKILHIEAVR